MADKGRQARVKQFIDLFEKLSPEDQADCERRMEASIAAAHSRATPEQLALVENTCRVAAEWQSRKAA